MGWKAPLWSNECRAQLAAGLAEREGCRAQSRGAFLKVQRESGRWHRSACVAPWSPTLHVYSPVSVPCFKASPLGRPFLYNNSTLERAPLKNGAVQAWCSVPQQGREQG